MLRRVLPVIGIFAAAVRAASGPAVHPLPPVPPASSTTTPTSDTDDVYYDSGPARYIDRLKLWQMTGGVTLNQGDTYLKTQSALVSLDKDLGAQSAQSLAPVHLYDSQNDVTADHGTIDFKTHIATLKDHITLIARPGKAKAGTLQSQSKDPSTMTCDLILYDYRHKTGKIPGALTIRQKDRVLVADSGTYDGNAKTVTLVGHVKGTQTDGSVITTDKLIAGISDGDQWIYIPGPIHALLKVKKQDEGRGGEKQPAPQAAPPPDLPLPPGASVEPAPTAPDTGAPAATPPAAPETDNR